MKAESEEYQIDSEVNAASFTSLGFKYFRQSSFGNASKKCGKEVNGIIVTAFDP